MGSGGWWLPPNFDPADCLAAYQFKGAGSESAALTDLTGHGYELTKNDPQSLMDFDNSAGFVWARNAWRTSRYLHNAELTKSLKITKAPTLLVPNGDKLDVYGNASEIKAFAESLNK